MNRFDFVRSLVRDLRLSVRLMAHSPGFTIAAVATLTLGIGANLALFTLLDAQFLRVRPFPAPREIYSVLPADSLGAPKFFHLSRPYYDAMRSDFKPLKALVGTSIAVPSLQTPDGVTEIRGQIVSCNYFDFLGARPILGRTFLPEEEGPAEHPVIVLSYRFWQQHFGGASNVIGNTIRLNGEMFEVIGVAADGFNGIGPGRVAFWAPVSVARAFSSNPTYYLFGRLDQGWSAKGAADLLSARILEVTKTLHAVEYPPDKIPPLARNNRDFKRVALEPAGYGIIPPEWRNFSRNDLRNVNSLAGFVTVLILLMAMANLTNLLLARGLSRRYEIATRIALGASRIELIRQQLIEGILLAFMGSGAALLAMFWLDKASFALKAAVIYSDGYVLNLHPDWHVVTAAVAGALLVGIGLSILPALATTRFDVYSALKNSHAGISMQGGRSPWRKALVIAQIAGSLLLASGVGLCLEAIRKEMRRDVGFQADGLLFVDLNLEQFGYPASNCVATCEILRERLAALPGATSAGIMIGAPFYGHNREVSYELPGRHGIESIYTVFPIGPGGFETLGIPLLRGNALTAGDFLSARPLAYVNEAFVKAFWPNETTEGKVIQRYRRDFQIAGVVRDAQLGRPNDPINPTLFPLIQPANAASPTFLVRTKATPAHLIPSVRAALSAFDPRFNPGVVTIRETFDGVFHEEKKTMNLLLEMAAISILLTFVGVFGLVSYMVKQRTREIGIRIAVGARRADILALISKLAFGMATAGIALGIPLVIGGAFLLRHIVQGIDPVQLPAYCWASLTVAVIVLAASLVPALRALRIEPMTALRSE
jgi:predicted permease